MGNSVHEMYSGSSTQYGGIPRNTMQNCTQLYYSYNMTKCHSHLAEQSFLFALWFHRLDTITIQIINITYVGDVVCLLTK